MSNLTSVVDWRLAVGHGAEAYDGMSASLARVAAEAVLHHPGDIEHDGFLSTLGEALLMSGLAMAGAGSSRPCSGACHEISHAIDYLMPAKSSPHGEQVGVGSLMSAQLQGDEASFDSLLATLRRHGLPTTPHDLGLTTEEFVEAVAYAPRTRPARITVLELRSLSTEEIRNEVHAYVERAH